MNRTKKQMIITTVAIFIINSLISIFNKPMYTEASDRPVAIESCLISTVLPEMWLLPLKPGLLFP